MGFFEWLDEIHELKDAGVDIEYLDGLALNDIHRTFLNSLAFRWFREQFNWQSSIEAINDQHSNRLVFNYYIWNSKTGEIHHSMPKDKPSGDWCFTSYEEAQIECILDLISIIKNQKK